MNQVKRPVSAGVSRKPFAQEPVLFCPNFLPRKTTEIPKDLSDNTVVKYNSRPSSASCVHRIFKKDQAKTSKDIDKSKCFLRISTSPLPFSKSSPAPSPFGSSPTNKSKTFSRPTSASVSKSAISIAKSSSTFKIGINTNENFRDLIEKNLNEQKKGRAPYQKTFTTQMGMDSDEEEEQDQRSRHEYSSPTKHKNPRPRSAALPNSSRPWSASTTSSTQRYAKKSRTLDIPVMTITPEPKKEVFSHISDLTSPHSLSHSSLPTSAHIEKKVSETPRKYSNLKPQTLTHSSSTSSISSSSSVKKTSSLVKNFYQNPNRNTPSKSEDYSSNSDIDLDDLEIKSYELDTNTLRYSYELSKRESMEKKPFTARSISITASNQLPSSKKNTPQSSKSQVTISTAFSEKQTQPKNLTPQSKTLNPSGSPSKKQNFTSPYSDFGLGEEFETALMDSTAILKTHILALPKTKNQIAKNASKKSGGHTSPQVRNDFLLSRNRFTTTSFAKAVERQNKAYTELVKEKPKITQSTDDISVFDSIQLVEKTIIYPALDSVVTFNNEESVRKIDLNIPLIDTKGDEKKEHKKVEKLTDSKIAQFSFITQSVNTVVETWGNNIETKEEKEEFKVIINDTQALQKMEELKESLEVINSYGSKAAKKTAKKNSEELSRYIIENDPNFFGFEVSKTFIEDLHHKATMDNDDDLTNIISDYKQDLTKSKKNTKSSDSEDEPKTKKVEQHRPLNLGKEKRRKINQKILDERIAEIKKYAWKYAELENRVKEIKRDIKKNEKKLNIQDHIKLNSTKQSQLEIQSSKEQALQKFSDRRSKALVTFHEQEKKRFEELEIKFEEKEKRRQNASSEKMSKVYKQKMWKLQKTWFPIVKMALFISQLTTPMIKERQVRKYEADVEWAHCILRRRLLPFILQRREQRQQAALQVIRKNWLIYVVNFRVRRKKRAANLIEKFVTDINKTSRIVRAVSRFITSVKRVQKFVKHFLFRRRIHLFVLNEQFKRCEKNLIKSTAREDFQEVRFKIVDVLKKMKETAFFEEPSTATETRAIQRKQGTSPTHNAHNSGFSDDTSNVRRTKLAVTEAKKTLKAVQKFVMDELKETTPTRSPTHAENRTSPRGRKGSFISTIDAVLRGSDRWNKGLDDFPYLIHIIEISSLKNDIVLRVGRMLRITPRQRCTKTKDEIRMKIVREDLSRRMYKIRLEQDENEKRKERNAQALIAQNKKFTEIQKRSVLKSDTTNQLIAKQIDIIEEEEEIERAQQELQKKRSVTFVPTGYMENLVRKGLEMTMREEGGFAAIEFSRSPKKKTTKSKSKKSSYKDFLAEEREHDFLEYEKLLQDLL